VGALTLALACGPWVERGWIRGACKARLFHEVERVSERRGGCRRYEACEDESSNKNDEVDARWDAL